MIASTRLRQDFGEASEHEHENMMNDMDKGSSNMKEATPGSYKEIFTLALPLVVSSGSWTIMHFTDRVFLSWYSEDALAASLPAGVTNFTFICFFMGVASYTGTFVAQYSGARQFDRIGRIVWQGVFFSFLSTLLLLPLIPLSLPLFRFIGHPGNIPELEAQYFRILCYGMGFSLLSSAFSSFFIGLGRTRIVMIVNLLIASLNIVLDYAWIFGKWGFPRWGIRGAAWATSISAMIGALIIVALYLFPGNQKRYATISSFGFDSKLFIRLLKFGLPSGLQFLLDMACFTLFVLMVGRLGKLQLVATNIAFNVNVFAFMPMIGFGIAASTLVGQYLGSNKPDIAVICVRKMFRLTILYMGTVAISYILFPDLYVRLYGSRENPALLAEIHRMARILLLFVAVYSFFDAMNMIYISALKGAGDTFFVMIVIVISSLFIVVIPTYICCVIYKGSIYLAWTFFSIYVIFVAFVFLIRYRGGKWKSMRVIETRVSELSPAPGALSESEIMR